MTTDSSPYSSEQSKADRKRGYRVKRDSGSYRRQLEGYRAFIPHPLPPDPPVAYDQELRRLLSDADLALGRLDGSVEALPNPELFVFMYVRKEAVLSSQIEGTQASLGDLLEAEARLFDPHRPDDTEEIVNYVAAMNHGLERLRDLPLSLRLIREIHQRLMQGVRGQHATPGEFRRSQNWIGAAGSSLSTASFVPPPPALLPDILGNLENFLHRNDHLPTLIRLGLIHAQFETIHPFLDGNGRVGRLLITFCLCEAKILGSPVLYLSHYFKRHRERYYDLLQATREDGEWEAWLKFFLTGIAEVANEAAATAKKIVRLREDHRDVLINRLGRASANGLRLLESMYQRPIFTVSNVRELLGVTYQAANDWTDRFMTLGLIAEITGNKRNRVFRYDPYVRLFTD